MIDLHAHSNHSDGIDSPSELVQNAKSAGVTVLAITDHDTVSGWDEAIVAAGSAGIGLVQGLRSRLARNWTPSAAFLSIYLLICLIQVLDR